MLIYCRNPRNALVQALDGFCFILDDRFHILYITESVSTHLGFSQVYELPERLAELNSVGFEYWRQLGLDLHLLALRAPPSPQCIKCRPVLLQVQMVGCCMSDFVHPEDFSVLNHVMSINVGVPHCYAQK